MRLFLALFLLALPAYAQAQTTASITIVIQSPPSTSVSCGTTTSYTLTEPVAAGTVVCQLAVQPTTWQGALQVQQTAGPQANAFTVNSSNQLVVGSVALMTVGNYAVTITATP